MFYSAWGSLENKEDTTENFNNTTNNVVETFFNSPPINSDITRVVIQGIENTVIPALQLSQIVIVDMNDNIIKPITINASPVYAGAQGKLKEIVFDGTFNPRAFPNIYHSVEGQTSNHFVISIPPSTIKNIIIYNRSDCCAERLQNYTLMLYAANKIKAAVQLNAEQIQVYTSFNAEGNLLLDNNKDSIIKTVKDKLTSGNSISCNRIRIFGSNYLQLAQIVIVDINNKKIQPTSIVASPLYPGGKSEQIVFDGTFAPRRFPDIYHSAGAGNVSFDIQFPLNMIKHVIIYNRSDCCADRLASFKLTCFMTSQELTAIQLNGNQIQAYSFVNSTITSTPDTSINAIIQSIVA